MSEPFAFLDDEELEEESKGVAWLPLSMAGLALAGFLSVPVLGLLSNRDKESAEAQFPQEEAIPASLESIEAPPLLTPGEEELSRSLDDIDATLASLGAEEEDTLAAYSSETTSERCSFHRTCQRRVELDSGSGC